MPLGIGRDSLGPLRMAVVCALLAAECWHWHAGLARSWRIRLSLMYAVTQPIAWVMLTWFLALLLIGRYQRLAQRALWVGLFVLGVLGFQTIPDSLIRLLEDPQRAPGLANLERYSGVIVLGGGVGGPSSFIKYGQIPLNSAAERLTMSMVLMRHYPRFSLVISGGEGDLPSVKVTEAAMAKQFFVEQGLEPTRIRLEDRSLNTRQNAAMVAKLLGRECHSPWLLVTSAWHMQRALAAFKSWGCNVTAFPVDFRTGEQTPWTEYSIPLSLQRWQIALHEWLGWVLFKFSASIRQ
jgi:uncharacterized SAM-binding protein YcdF (DUF218 family)